MKQGSVYKLFNLYGSRNKLVYRVADHSVTVSFSHNSIMFFNICTKKNSIMSVLEDSPIPFDEECFRFHSYEDFEANYDLKGDLCGRHYKFSKHL